VRLLRRMDQAHRRRPACGPAQARCARPGGPPRGASRGYRRDAASCRSAGMCTRSAGRHSPLLFPLRCAACPLEAELGQKLADQVRRSMFAAIISVFANMLMRRARTNSEHHRSFKQHFDVQVLCRARVPLGQRFLCLPWRLLPAQGRPKRKRRRQMAKGAPARRKRALRWASSPLRCSRVRTGTVATNVLISPACRRVLGPQGSGVAFLRNTSCTQT
jgi:hypothetical protein